MYKNLNIEQQKAVLTESKVALIVAGAGSGKTTVLVSRTGHILESAGVKPEEICVLTFTTKAARELKTRVAHKVGPRGKKLWTGTFHSFGLHVLRKHHKALSLPSGFGVIDQGDSTEIIKELMAGIRDSAKAGYKVERILALINEWRASGRRTPQNESDDYEVMAQVVLPKYLKRLESLGVVDFEGLLLKPIELFKNHPEILQEVRGQFKHVMVDEFQDTDALQYQLFDHIAQQPSHLLILING